MSDVEQGASSAPAEATAALDLDALSAPDLASWRMTGKVPDPTPPADPSPAEPVEQAASTDATSEPAPEPAKPKKGADARIPELLADRAKERDRAEKAERRIAELEARATRQPDPPTSTAVSSTAPAGDPEPNPDDATKYPDGQFDRQFLKDQARWETRQELQAERDRWTAAQRNESARVERQRLVSAMTDKVTAAKAKYDDFQAIALDAPSRIEPGSPIDVWIWEDPSGAEVLYHLQKHPTELDAIVQQPVLGQLKTLALLAHRLTSPDPPADSTHAPPPPHTLPTRAAPGDPVARALASDDFSAYRDAMNRRDLARIR